MNKCQECGTENEDKYQYCKNCGARLNIDVKTDVPNNHEFINNTDYSQQTNNYQQNPYQQNPYQQNQSNTNYNGENQNNYSTDKNEYQQNQNNYSSPYNNNQQSTNQYSQYNQYNQQANNGYNNYSNYNNYQAEQPQQNQYPMEIDSIPSDEIGLYIGKKANVILPKFYKMKLTNSKVSWCWPPAILAFFMGPIGAAIWFFYRKMYKIACLLLVLGAVSITATSILTYNTTSDITDSIMNGINNNESFFDIIGNIANGDFSTSINNVIANGITNVFRIGTLIFTGLFGYFAYKNKCVSSINKFRSTNPDPRYYRIGLTSIGGVSGGMVLIGILAFFIITYIPSIIQTFSSVIK